MCAWTSYRDFWFDNGSAEIRDSDSSKLAEVAAYMNANPSLEIAIDGNVDPRSGNSQNQKLCDRRANAIHDALVEAGVPDGKIRVGAYGDAGLRRDRRVEVLIATAN
jgi:outer membrane protein OmpA-like peptidoglycan-associated protein